MCQQVVSRNGQLVACVAVAVSCGPVLGRVRCYGRSSDPESVWSFSRSNSTECSFVISCIVVDILCGSSLVSL